MRRSSIRRRQVERDADVDADRLPAVELAHRLLDHPVGDRRHEAGALGGGQEEAGADQLAATVPAHERLDALHRSGGEVDDRLVLEHELAE